MVGGGERGGCVQEAVLTVFYLELSQMGHWSVCVHILMC